MSQQTILCPIGVTWRALMRQYSVASTLLIVSAFGQSPGSGILSGFVSNKATGDLLPGAVIQVEGTNISTVTERGGTYRLPLNPGVYTITVSFPGLDTARAPVSIATGEPTVHDVTLTSTIYQLEAFSVPGVREGSALAIQAQRLAETPKWVAAIDTFGNPAPNPGELIQRLPGITTDIVGSEVRSVFVRGMGPGFSALLIDGERVATSTGTSASRDYQIEQYGTGSLEAVELIKAPQPEQDANAVAGFINLVSRRAFDLPGRRITLTGGVMWRHRDGMEGSPFKDDPGGLDVINFGYSDVYNVFGGKNNLGVSFNANRRVAATTSDEMGPAGVLFTALGQSYLNPGSANPLARIFGTGDFGHVSKANNGGLSVDLKISDEAYAFVKFSLNHNVHYQKYYRPAFGNAAATAANFSPDSTFEHSFLLPHAASIGISESSPAFTKYSKNFGLNGGTEVAFFDRFMTLNVRGNYSKADISYPGWIRSQARTNGGIGFEIDRRGRDPWYPLFRQTDGPSIYDPDSYTIRTMQRQSYKSPNEYYGGRADLAMKFETAAPSSIKMGLKYNSDIRRPTTNLAMFTWFGADGVANSADDVMTPYTDLHYNQGGGGRYGPFPFMTNVAGAPAEYWRQTAADVYTSYATSNTGDARFMETIAAGYIQASVKLGRLKILGGLRVEDTDTEGTAWVRNTTPSWGGNNSGGASIVPATVAANLERAQRSFVRRNTLRGSYRKVFPGLHFVYEPRSALLVRASYNRAISRPPVPNLIPTVTENPDTNLITMGNPDLKPYLSDNFEVSIEKYFEPVGVFSVGVFLKEISNYFRSFDTIAGSEGIDGAGSYAGYTVRTSRNTGQARIRGIEVSYQQQFSFLPGPLKGLGAFANFTYLETYGDFGTLTTTSRLPNLAPRSGNAGLNYRFRGLDARLLTNWTGRKYLTTNAGVDVYMDDRLMFDLKLHYRLNPQYYIFLDVVNLTDEPTRAQVTLNRLHFSRYNQGVGFSAGFGARF